MLAARLVNVPGVSDVFREGFITYSNKAKRKIQMCIRDRIMTGFLGSREQIEIVTDFIRYFKRENTVVLVDPIMGDHGEAYATYTPQMCEEMKELVQYAGIVTPNVTEMCIRDRRRAFWRAGGFRCAAM